MNILWLSHLVPYPPKSGALLRAYYLLRATAARHNLDLVAFIQEPLLATFYPNLDAALRDCEKNLAAFCRSVTLLPIERLKRPLGMVRTAGESLFASHGYVGSWLRSPRASATIAELAAQRRYDVAHFDYEGLAPYRSLLGPVPATLGHHNAESHMMKRRADNERRPLHKLYFRQEAIRVARYERQIASQFALHIACSELDITRLQETMPGARFANVPNGVDIEYFAPQGTPTRPESLVFVSSMSWYPNVDAALFLLREIWPRVRARHPAATLDIIGAHAPPSVVAAAQSQGGVTLHGFVPDIRPIVDSAAIYVCPVRDGGGTKLKILDALAMSKAIVAHPIACEGIQITEGREAVYADSADEFAARIGELFGDAPRRARIGAAGRELAARHYSFDALGAKFSGLLEDAAATRAASRIA